MKNDILKIINIMSQVKVTFESCHCVMATDKESEQTKSNDKPFFKTNKWTKLWDLLKEKFVIHACLGSVYFMGLFNIYKLGHLAYHIYPKVLESSKDSLEKLVGIMHDRIKDLRAC